MLAEPITPDIIIPKSELPDWEWGRTEHPPSLCIKFVMACMGIKIHSMSVLSWGIEALASQCIPSFAILWCIYRNLRLGHFPVLKIWAPRSPTFTKLNVHLPNLTDYRLGSGNLARPYNWDYLMLKSPLTKYVCGYASRCSPPHLGFCIDGLFSS